MNRQLKIKSGIFLIILMMGINPANAQNPMIQKLNNWELISSKDLENIQDLNSINWKSDPSIKIEVPNTVFGALVEEGQIKNPFYGDQLRSYDRSAYDITWIYRTNFDLNQKVPHEHIELILEGFNYSANVWLNGILIGDSSTLIGPFRIYHLDITQQAKPKDNQLIIEVFPPQKGDLTIGWVDWNPYPPDDNMGLWRPVKVKQSGIVSFHTAFVETSIDKEKFEWAELKITADIENQSTIVQEGRLKGTIGEMEFSLDYMLEPNEKKQIVFSPQTSPQLRIADPKIWWPNRLGEQPLYHLKLELSNSDGLSDQYQTRFGIREVATYINEEGHRGYMVNGKKILIKGEAG